MTITTTQFNLFGEPEVNKVRKARRKMSEREKEERREKKALEKRLAADKEFERKWAERGVFQGQLFNDNIEKQGMDENRIERNMKKQIIRLTEQDLYDMINECVGKVLNEGVN